MFARDDDGLRTVGLVRTSARKSKAGLDRRHVLRGLGACLALPLLEAMLPRRGPAPATRRLAVFTTPFGMVEEWFRPATTGAAYEPGPALLPLAPLRSRLTVFSGLDHGLKGGHAANHTLLSGVRSTERGAYPEGNVTVDQRAAEVLGSDTRFPSLVLWEEGMSFTRTGVRVPSIKRPSEAFRLLFVEETEEEHRFTRASLASRASILDAVRSDARALEERLGRTDREKLDEYFTAIRETEGRMQATEQWLGRPKPKPADPAARGLADGTRDEPYGKVLCEAWLDLAYLALWTDSTRVVTTSVSNANFGLDGVDQGYHTLSHHGHREDRLAQLRLIEVFLMEQLARFLGRLAGARQPDGSTLLDSTQVLFGSGLGNGNRHTNSNLPILLAGGGFRHGQHLDAGGKQPLCNLYLSMLRALGCELERFNLSTGTLAGLPILDEATSEGR
jgi:uncharacterized protein DUF1552